MKLLTITVARRTMTEASVAKNALRWATGVINIDACRVGTGKDKGVWPVTDRPLNAVYGVLAAPPETDLTKGRWPTNLILLHHPECKPLDAWVCVPECPAGYDDEGTTARYFKQIRGETTMSTIPDELIEYLRVLIAPPEPAGAPLYMPDLDETDWDAVSKWADNSITGVIARGTPTDDQVAELMRVLTPGAHLLLIAPEEQPTGHTGACRLEDGGFEIRDAILLAREAGALHYVPKASRSEREAGCWGLEGKSGAEAVDRKEGSDGMASPRAGANRTARKVTNFHPTVKPVLVMERLLADIPEDAVVFDPFMGSGSTGIACAKTGHDFIGIDREEEYLEIADSRVRHWRTQFAGHGKRATVDSDFEGGEDDITIKEKPDSPLADLFWED